MNPYILAFFILAGTALVLCGITLFDGAASDAWRGR